MGELGPGIGQSASERSEGVEDQGVARRVRATDTLLRWSPRVVHVVLPRLCRAGGRVSVRVIARAGAGQRRTFRNASPRKVQHGDGGGFQHGGNEGAVNLVCCALCNARARLVYANADTGRCALASGADGTHLAYNLAQEEEIQLG